MKQWRLKLDNILTQSLLIVGNHSNSGKDPFDTLRRLLDKATNKDKIKQDENYNGNHECIKCKTNDIISMRQKWPVYQLRCLQQSALKLAHNRIDYALNNNFGLASRPIIICHYNGRDWLIDGGTRINFWNSKGDASKKLSVNYHIFPSETNHEAQNSTHV